MGVKTKIDKIHLPLRYEDLDLKETKYGVSDSVYLLGDKYVLKLFENSDNKAIENEISFIKLLRDNSLLVPDIIDSFKIEDKDVLIYTQLKGRSVFEPSDLHIQKIGLFLRSFHNTTKGKSSSNKKIFEKNIVEEMLKKSNNKRLKEVYSSIEIELKNDGLIHGDMFPDNVKFYNDELSGVYDFSEFCEGDFYFDLGVIAISWCVDEGLSKRKIEILLKSYSSKKSYEEFIPYMRYALLYYCLLRDIDKRDYRNLLNILKYL